MRQYRKRRREESWWVRVLLDAPEIDGNGFSRDTLGAVFRARPGPRHELIDARCRPQIDELRQDIVPRSRIAGVYLTTSKSSVA
jgi:hypothetical protein